MPLNRTPPTTSPPHHASDPNISVSQDMEIPSKQSITFRKRKRNEDENTVSKTELTELFSTWKSEQDNKFSTWKSEQDNKFDKLLSCMEEIKHQNDDIRNSMEFMSLQYDNLLTKVDSLESGRADDRKRIQFLEGKIDSLERNLRSSSLEIRNVPAQSHESKSSLMTLIQEAGKTLNVMIQPQDIRDVYRVNTKTENKPIIADFISVIKRDSLITSIKKYNRDNANSKFSTSNLQIEGPSKPVYITELLTFQAKKLYFMARDFAKQNDYRFCWATHGKIYLRKAEGQPLIRIETESDLNKIAKKD